jgi:hypothetical protein
MGRLILSSYPDTVQVKCHNGNGFATIDVWDMTVRVHNKDRTLEQPKWLKSSVTGKRDSAFMTHEEFRNVIWASTLESFVFYADDKIGYLYLKNEYDVQKIVCFMDFSWV